MKGVRYKPWPRGNQACPQPKLPSRRRGVGAGKKWEPRTAKYQALVIHTRSADNIVHGVLDTREMEQ